MGLRIRIKDIVRSLLYVYLALKVLFIGYSNTYELLFSVLILLLNVVIVCRHRLAGIIGKIVAGCLILCIWMLLSIVSGHSGGNLGTVYMLMEWLCCIVNTVWVINEFDLNDKRKLYFYIYIITVFSLGYNIYSYAIHPEYRLNIYLATQIKGRFIGGVSYAMYIGFFAIIQLHDLLFYKDKYNTFLKIIKGCTLVAAVYYMITSSPSATVLLISLITAIISCFISLSVKNGRRKGIVLNVLILILIGPAALWFIINYIAGHIDVSSRLYDRFNAIVSAIKSPGEMLTSAYFLRISMLLNEIKITFSSVKMFLIGKGYNFGTYTSVAQQLERLGIGYHSSMIDWFPTYGFICGIVLWWTIYNIQNYIKRITIGYMPTIVWESYIVYCFLNSGFTSMLIIMVLLFNVIHQQIIRDFETNE